MPVTQPTYDLILMLDTSVDAERRTKILADSRAMVAKAGEVTNEQDWGARTLAFEIDKKTDAEYHLLQFHGTPDLLRELHRTLRITDGVVRYRIIKLAPGTPDDPELRPERAPVAAAPVATAPVEAPPVEAAGAEPAPVEAEPAAAEPEPEPAPVEPEPAEPEPAAAESAEAEPVGAAAPKDA